MPMAIFLFCQRRFFLILDALFRCGTGGASGNVKNGHPDVSVAKQVRALHQRKEPAMKSLGLDAHSATFTLAVLT
ncbi:MAG TPA: hypothetical protein VKX17_28755, partial [Planctomycetota bacterium]|nr:hypothetical protein [Planctomycetota bacterium]